MDRDGHGDGSMQTSVGKELIMPSYPYSHPCFLSFPFPPKHPTVDGQARDYGRIRNSSGDLLLTASTQAFRGLLASSAMETEKA